MQVFGTQMHIVTAVFVLLETMLLAGQTIRYLLRLEDKHRVRYSILLLLLIIYDITRGLFPDAQLSLPIRYQHMISYGAGFITASYFPFYFYKEFDLQQLKWHAKIGVPLFLLAPYFIFFVVIYAINDDFIMDVRLGIVIPFIYAVVLLWAILRAIRQHYQQHRDHHFYTEEITVYCAVFPWVAMGAFVWLQMDQVTEVLFTNLGFVIITILFFVRSARRAKAEHRRKRHNRSVIFDANCQLYKLTTREKDVARSLADGLSYKQIAEKLYLSENTVNNYIQRIYEKTGVRKRHTLINKLFEN
ncbi:DNA-binding CsgD family transcriptional regulator [Mucilaginibacter sp. SG538B]|uniref:helix-turn-helix transcriptional regulator n=1 Tax=Mucilaginibacter sp. SG538B TaxID=2587021 RepID=UPI00159D0F82|nr:LuxR C-terminal-related transcriptional regulator [Mucilaginibacter sp. SG538B]NVM65062.1 DNA-binding CsgD family transcriptional regulator [Mucilaginibacter sp. SG538B]